MSATRTTCTCSSSRATCAFVLLVVGVSVLALKVCAEAQNDNPLNWSPDMVAKLREGFELADTDEPKKFLTRKELASAFEKFGFQFLLNSIDLVYKETDLNEDTLIDFGEWSKDRTLGSNVLFYLQTVDESPKEGKETVNEGPAAFASAEEGPSNTTEASSLEEASVLVDKLQGKVDGSLAKEGKEDSNSTLWSPDAADKLNEAFLLADMDESGTLTKEELRQALEMFGFAFMVPSLDSILRQPTLTTTVF